MKIINRYLFYELVKFTLLALLSVVTIYLLIDLFEELNYFTSRKASLLVVLFYYFYSLPAAVTLLYPVSLILSIFVVYGRMTRYNEIAALKSAGVMIYRLFVPALVAGGATVFLYFVGNELITIPFNRRLSDLRRYTIEKRGIPVEQRRINVYRVNGNQILWAHDVSTDEKNGENLKLRNFMIIELDKDRLATLRIDGETAVYEDSGWIGFNLVRRTFSKEGGVIYKRFNQAKLDGLNINLDDWLTPARPVEEISTRILKKYIQRLKTAGENVTREEVEFHYRFSYAFIGLIVTLLGLPLSVRLRRGGVMLGLGLGLLFSFLYWGTIQVCRAFGTSHIISPALSAWLPNVVFGLAAFSMLFKVEK